MVLLGSKRPFLLTTNLGLSLLFIVFSVAALMGRPDLDPFYVGFCLVLFLAGMISMGAALFVAISASRYKEISLAGVFFLGHGSVEKGTRNWFMGLLCLQIVVSIVVAALAPFTSTVFAVLVPLLGFGLMGLQGALHGKFEPLP